MAKAQWSTTPREIVAQVDVDGTFEFSAPLLDNKVKQGTLRILMSADRELTVFWEEEAGVEGLLDFRAWTRRWVSS